MPADEAKNEVLERLVRKCVVHAIQRSFQADAALSLGPSPEQAVQTADADHYPKFSFLVFRPVHWKLALQKRHNYGETAFVGPSLDEAAVVQHTVVSRRFAKNTLQKDDAAAESNLVALAEPVDCIYLYALPSTLRYVQLRANLIRWKRAEKVTYHLHSSVHVDCETQASKAAVSRVLGELLQKGALPGTNTTWTSASIQDAAEVDALQGLVKTGSVEETQTTTTASWQLTKVGVSAVLSHETLTQPASVVACVNSKDPKAKDIRDEMLYDVLWKQGWMCSVLS